MKQGRAVAVLLTLTRLALAGVFLYSGFLKLRPGSSPATDGVQIFAYSLESFKILPDHLVPPFAFVVPWTEILAAACLLVGLWTRAAGLLIVLLLGTFIAAIVSVIERGMNVKCGCFGNYRLACTGPLGWCHVVQNSVLLLGAAVVAIGGGGRLSVDGLWRTCCPRKTDPAKP